MSGASRPVRPMRSPSALTPRSTSPGSSPSARPREAGRPSPSRCRRSRSAELRRRRRKPPRSRRSRAPRVRGRRGTPSPTAAPVGPRRSRRISQTAASTISGTANARSSDVDRTRREREVRHGARQPAAGDRAGDLAEPQHREEARDDDEEPTCDPPREPETEASPDRVVKGEHGQDERPGRETEDGDVDRRQRVDHDRECVDRVGVREVPKGGE